MTPLLTNYLSIGEVGHLEMLVAAYNILSVFGIFQIDSALQRYFSSQNSNKYFSSLLIVFIFSIISGVMFAAIIYIHPIMNKDDVFVIIFTALSVNIFNIIQVLLRYSFDSIIRVSFISIIQAFLFFILFYISIDNEKLSVLNYFYFLSFSYVFSSVIALFFLRKNITLIFDFKLIREYLTFSIPLFPARFLSSLAQYGNRFIIAMFLSSSSVAIFSVSSKVSLAYSIILTAFNMVWYPIVYKDNEVKRGNIIFRYTVMLLIILSPILCFLSYVYFSYFISVEYSEGIYISYVLIYSFSFYILKEMVETPIKINGETKIISVCYIIYVSFQIILMFIFGYFYKLYGIVFSILISNIFLVAVTWYFSNKYDNDLCDFKFFIMYLFSGLLVLVFLWIKF